MRADLLLTCLLVTALSGCSSVPGAGFVAEGPVSIDCVAVKDELYDGYDFEVSDCSVETRELWADCHTPKDDTPRANTWTCTFLTFTFANTGERNVRLTNIMAASNDELVMVDGSANDGIGLRGNDAVASGDSVTVTMVVGTGPEPFCVLDAHPRYTSAGTSWHIHFPTPAC